MSDDSLRPPEPSRNDKAADAGRAVVKGALGAVPIAGGLLAEVADLMFKRPIDKRRDAWMADVANAVEEIRATQAEMTPDKLAENEEFITILHRATDVAIRTHEQQKRLLLRNALVNAAVPSSPVLDLQEYFIRLVDELSVNQIIILDLYDDPSAWFRKRERRPPDLIAGSRTAVLETAYPTLFQYQHVRELQIGDLERRGLLGGLHGMISGSAILSRATSTLAHEFIAYIRSTGTPLTLDPTI